MSGRRHSSNVYRRNFNAVDMLDRKNNQIAFPKHKHERGNIMLGMIRFAVQNTYALWCNEKGYMKVGSFIEKLGRVAHRSGRIRHVV